MGLGDETNKANSSLNAENICIETKALVFNLGVYFTLLSSQQLRAGCLGSSKVQKHSHTLLAPTGVLCSVAIPQ